jgi:8-oxo-dGTP diphosphatase
MNPSGFLHALNLFLARNLFFLLLAVLVLNMAQRRHHGESLRKRFATLYIAVLALALMCGIIVIVHFQLPDLLMLPVLGGLVLVGYLNRRHVFPFRLRCSRCREPLSFDRVLYFDDNTCRRCAAPPSGEAGPAGLSRP